MRAIALALFVSVLCAACGESEPAVAPEPDAVVIPDAAVDDVEGETTDTAGDALEEVEEDVAIPIPDVTEDVAPEDAPLTDNCVGVINGDPCDDGDPCTENDSCEFGACGGTPKICDDAIVCTADSCDEATGECRFEADPAVTQCGVATGTCNKQCGKIVADVQEIRSETNITLNFKLRHPDKV